METSQPVMSFKRQEDNMYTTTFHQVPMETATRFHKSYVATNTGSTKEIHEAMGHLSISTMNQLKGNVTGLPTNFRPRPDEINNCLPCAETNGTRHPFRTGSTIRTKRGELIHSDYVVFPTATPKGYTGFVAFIDDNIRFACMYLSP
jgi:hypothetical protein